MAKDITLLAESIELLYLGVKKASYWEEFVTHNQKLFGTSQASLVLTDHKDPSKNTGITTFDEDLIREYYGYYTHKDVWVRTALSRGITNQSVIDCEELVSDKDIVKTEFYADFMKKADMRYALSSAITSSEDLSVYFTLNKPHSSGRFTNQEKAYLSMLAPHLKQAVELNKIINLSILNSSVAAADGKQAIIGWGNNGSIVYLSHIASHLLNNRTVELIGEHVVLNGNNIGRQVSDFLTTGQTKEKTYALRHINSSEISYLHKVKPVNSEGSKLFGARKEIKALSVIYPLKSPEPGVKLFSEFFSLSTREFDVLLCLANGLTLSETSGVLKISKETGRTHLKNIFAKVNVNSQPELLSLISSFNV